MITKIISSTKGVYLAILLSALVLPNVVLAAPKDFAGLVKVFTDIIGAAVPVVVLLAVLYFFWGLTKYIFAQGNEGQKVDGKNIMLWGLIGLFFIFAIYGVIRLFGGILPSFPA